MAKKEKESGFNREVEIPQGISVNFSESSIIVEGSGKKLEKKFLFGLLNPEVKEGKVIVTSLRNTKREKTLFGTLRAVLNNLFSGISSNFIYKLKICSGHFPMNVSLSGRDFTIKNFLGEAVPRKTTLPENASVKVEGDMITIESEDKELAGRVAATIENLTKIKRRDKRIFQDGIYIIQKHHKIL